MGKVTVTGGAGFIGSHLVEALLTEGMQVTVLDNLSTGKKENLRRVLREIEFVQGDLMDFETVVRCLRGRDVVYHLGALPSVPRSLADPWNTHQVNVSGTLRVLMASRDCRVQRMILASSSSVYGKDHVLPLKEDMLLAPLSPYAASKASCECYASAFAQSHGLYTVSLRFFNVFGPRQDPASQYSAVIPKFIRNAMSGDAVEIYGDGTQSRDFTYVENVVDACIKASRSPGCQGKKINVACGQRRSLLDLIRAIENLSGKELSCRYMPSREGEVPHSEADISAARTLLGYHPMISFEDGIQRVWEWMGERSR